MILFQTQDPPWRLNPGHTSKTGISGPAPGFLCQFEHIEVLRENIQSYCHKGELSLQ